MLSYRDMTFCPHYEDCAHASKCPRPLTPQVRMDAAKWWGDTNGDGAPISVFAFAPDCHEPRDLIAHAKTGGPRT